MFESESFRYDSDVVDQDASQNAKSINCAAVSCASAHFCCLCRLTYLFEMMYFNVVLL